jgi:hypothetical protein
MDGISPIRLSLSGDHLWQPDLLNLSRSSTEELTPYLYHRSLKMKAKKGKTSVVGVIKGSIIVPRNFLRGKPPGHFFSLSDTLRSIYTRLAGETQETLNLLHLMLLCSLKKDSPARETE